MITRTTFSQKATRQNNVGHESDLVDAERSVPLIVGDGHRACRQSMTDSHGGPPWPGMSVCVPLGCDIRRNSQGGGFDVLVYRGQCSVPLHLRHTGRLSCQLHFGLFSNGFMVSGKRHPTVDASVSKTRFLVECQQSSMIYELAKMAVCLYRYSNSWHRSAL